MSWSAVAGRLTPIEPDGTFASLAPDLQEHIMFAEAVAGVEPTTEGAVRVVARAYGWAAQRAAWHLKTA